MKQKYKELNENSKNVLKIGIAVLILLLFFLFNIYSNYNQKKQEFEKSKIKSVVQDKNRYFTVINCINKYLNTVQSNKKDDILLLLQPEYKEKNSINKDNLYNYIDKLEKDYIYTFNGKKMHQKRISKNVTEFYVTGNVKKSTINNDLLSEPSKFTVILYENKFVYSIKPEIDEND